MIIHPEQKPLWLSSWLTQAEMQERFTVIMRNYAARTVIREHTQQLNWDDQTLRVILGVHVCVWTLQSDGRWTTQCTCRRDARECFHAYAGHLMLQKVCREEGWPMPVSSPSQPGANTVRHPACPSSSFGHGGHNFFASENAFQMWAEAQKQNGFGSNQPWEGLVAELDFQGTQESAGLRVYGIQERRRVLLKLSQVRNEASRLLLAKVEKGVAVHWNEHDSKFLLWLLPYLQKMDVRKLEMNTLHVQLPILKEWLQHWETDPKRFIVRENQKILNPHGVKQPASFHVELYRTENKVRVVVVLPAADGTKQFLHQLIEYAKEDPSRFYVRDRIFSYTPPLSWKHLGRYFQNGAALVLTPSEVVNQLPQILAGRLDLLQESPLVKIHRNNQVDFKLDCYLDSAGTISLSLRRQDGTLLPLAAQQQSLSTIHWSRDHFEVELFENVHLRQMFEHLAQLKEEAGPAVVPDERSLRLVLTDSSASRIRKFWQGLPEGMPRRISTQLEGIVSKPVAPKVELSLSMQNGLVHFSQRGRLGDYQLTTMEMRSLAAGGKECFFHRGGGDWFCLDAEEIRQAMERLREELGGEMEELLLPSKAADRLKKLQRMPQISLTPDSCETANFLRSRTYVAVPALAAPVGVDLRTYQEEGVHFLLERIINGIGAVLADDMGLGKTLQVLTVFATLCKQNPAAIGLVVCPASVIDIWVAQAQRFFPGMSVVAVRGTREQRDYLMKGLHSTLYVTHYGLLRADLELYQTVRFSLVALDEAQAVKNPQAQVTQAVRALHAENKIALTGTPLENSIKDVISILNCVQPGICASLEGESRAQFDSPLLLARMRQLLQLLMIRRTKELVAPELPPRTEENVFLDMPSEVRDGYARELALQRISAGGGQYTAVLAALMKMRRFCCAPALVGQEQLNSVKLEWLLERLRQVLDSGHSALVFSQFTDVLALVQNGLEQAGIPWHCITGETPLEKRGGIVQRFQESKEDSVFLLSLKAAGTGLTLTRADYVFLFDPWWNPAVEDQAIDRTHRIGQTKPIFAYRLLLRDSVEEKVFAILQQKRDLFKTVVEGSDATGAAPLSLAELRSLLS